MPTKLEVLEQTAERNSVVYQEFQKQFDKEIADINAPDDGITRMQRLQRMVRSMNVQINESNMKFVSSLIDGIDEEAVIEQKKENS